MARTRAAEIAREVTGRELLAAALEVFVEKGYHATTISDIVQAAGVTQGTFYLYYKNKADIFSALLREYRQLTISGLFNVDLNMVRTQRGWLRLADGIARFLLDHIETHGDFLRLFVAETSTIGSEFIEESAAFAAGMMAEISRLLRHGIELGLLRDDMDVEAVALSAFGALKEAINQSCFRDGLRRPEDIIPRVIRSQAELLLK
jgi:AcrR family transcriptional regulator